jgi:hypothetical protein
MRGLLEVGGYGRLQMVALPQPHPTSTNDGTQSKFTRSGTLSNTSPGLADIQTLLALASAVYIVAVLFRW